MTKKQLIRIIRENPGWHLYYHDNGSWILYKSKPKEGEDWESLELAEGNDWDMLNCGYLPFLVKVLADIAGITSDSV